MVRLRTGPEPHLSTNPRTPEVHENEPLLLSEILKQIGKRLAIWLGIGGGILLVSLGGWWLLSPQSPVGSDAVVHIMAHTAPFFEDPVPGNEQVQHQDKAIFQHLYPSPPGEGETQVEHLLPPPETPILPTEPVAVMNPFEAPSSEETPPPVPIDDTPPLASEPAPSPKIEKDVEKVVLQEIETETKALKEEKPEKPAPKKEPPAKEKTPKESKSPSTLKMPVKAPVLSEVQPIKLPPAPPKQLTPQVLSPQAPPPPSPKSPTINRSYQIQIGGSYPTQKHAQEAWVSLASRFPGEAPRIQRVPGLGGGGQYQILIGQFSSFADAQAACRKGGGSCTPRPL